jgi:two-component system, OmpR family, alkaline phosphatase synthesis response regulator PhoP
LPAKVLIVDDDKDLREMWFAIFSMEGFTVITAENGSEGYKAAQREQPDIIVTDLNMPEIDGTNMIKRLRAHPDLRKVPIVALSAYSGQQGEEALKAGANLLMQKPVETERLIETVKQLLGLDGKLD